MIIKVIALVMATICDVLFLTGLKKENIYADYIEGLDEARYPMKEFYVVGLYLNELKLFKLRGKLGENLKEQAKLLLDNSYYEYFALMTWVQFLTATLFTCCVGFTLCGLVASESMIMVVGIMGLAIMAEWNLIVSNMKEKVQARREACELEFPNMISKLSLLIDSGMVLREAWELVAYRKKGDLYELMQRTCEDMRNGDSDITAINNFGVLSDSAEIKKFSSSMIQGIEKGNSELSAFLMGQASEQLLHKRQMALQQGEKAAGKLIIPLGITFIGIIMIIVSAAMQGLTF